MATVQTATTEQMLDMVAADGIPRELIRGELRELPMTTNPSHARTVARMSQLLNNYLDAQASPAGELFSGDCTFRLRRGEQETTVGIDVAFVAAHRLPPGNRRARFLDLAPDLAIEVLSPSETVEDVEDRVDLFLHAGIALIWMVNPLAGTITVIRSATDRQLVTGSGELDGGSVLPGFRCPAAEVFR